MSRQLTVVHGYVFSRPLKLERTRAFIAALYV